MFKRWLKVATLVLPLVIIFENCSGGSNSLKVAESSSITAPDGLPPINYFVTAPPPLICGPSGWSFMMTNYIRVNCSGCHYSGSIVAPIAFADNNSLIAYQQAQLVSASSWSQFVTKNTFCYPDCNLDTRGEIYQGLMQWAANKTCP